MARQLDYEDLTRMLPIDAYLRGWHLTWLAPALPTYADPIILGCPGQELYRWNYIPSLTEVFEVCQKLLKEVKP